MKHIEIYSKFIKLNEDMTIIGDINDYDLNIIKDALIDLEDFGLQIRTIYYDNVEDMFKIYLFIKTSKIADNISCEYKFNKMRIYKKTELQLYKGKYYTYKLDKYEKNIINIIKDCSILLLNMLDYVNGKFSFRYNMFTDTFDIDITLQKIKQNK